MGGYSPTATNYLVSEVKYLGPVVLMVLISRRYSSPGHAPRPGAPTGILPQIRCFHRDPPLHLALPLGSSPGINVPTRILPYTWRSHWNPPLDSTFQPGSFPRPDAPTGILPQFQCPLGSSPKPNSSHQDPLSVQGTHTISYPASGDFFPTWFQHLHSHSSC